MIRKLFLTARVLLGLFAAYVLAIQSYLVFQNKDEASYMDVLYYRNISEKQQVFTNISEEPSAIERSMVVSDKNSSLSNLLKYNSNAIEKIIFVFLSLGLIYVLEKWLFWLFRKDDPTKAHQS